ncbi:HAMP domain-containing sensor histidine kinase [Bacillus thuringiensis]|uniref:HAMP domain-containing sensor histidine kinase n=1 Tax=Bacillus thuringiensis TaxID=1428 RepID=UPI001EDD26FE|nr:HAMP domain-containing sensor histidine kinase [Bacillus thuringiensis]MCG3422302.1 HAMP domain-containing histidine kinase [Bacillus thuringiensis]
MKRNSSLFSIFVINYFAIIAVTIISVVIFISFILIRLSHDIEREPALLNIEAKDIVQSNYKEIRGDAVLKAGGWIEIIQNNKVVHVIGEKQDAVTEYTLNNLQHYMNTDETNSQDYSMNITPFTGNDEQPYFCIVKLPQQEATKKLFENIGVYAFQAFGIAFVFFLCVNSLLLFFSIRKLSRPMKKIQIGIKKMTEGDYSNKLQFQTYHEIEEIKNAFNYMAHELQIAQEEKIKSEENKKRLLRDITHDIRTPMTSIAGYSKALVDHSMDEQQQKKYLTYIHDKSLQLDNLIQDLLHFTKLDNPVYKLDRQPEDITEFIKETIVTYYGEIEAKNFALDLQLLEHPSIIQLDRKQMERAIGNIIINALKYNPIGTKLTISLSETEDTITLQIQDDGVGIPSDTINRIFLEFVRGDAARSSDGGSGLGLAISKRIIELHHGEITAQSETDTGTRFIITLPKQK